MSKWCDWGFLSWWSLLSGWQLLCLPCRHCAQRWDLVTLLYHFITILYSEITSPDYPASYGDNKMCRFSVKSEKGSQIAVNFADLDLAESDMAFNCESEYLEIKENENIPSSFFTKDGRKFCGKILPNYPGPSVITSGRYWMSSILLQLFLVMQFRL